MRMIFKCRNCAAHIYVAPNPVLPTDGEELLDQLMGEGQFSQFHIHRCNDETEELAIHGVADIIGTTER